MPQPAAPRHAHLGGPLPWVIAWRYLRGQRSRLLGGTARAALLSTALGVTAMVVAMALMTGYREDLQRKLVRGNAAVIAYPVGGAGAPAEAELRRLLAIPGVTAVGRVAYGQGTLSGPSGGDGVEVVLRGVEPGKGELTASAAQLQSRDGIPGAVVGKDLAASLRAEPGDVVRLVALGFLEGRPRFRYQSLRVADTFTTGFAEFDRGWVVLDRALVERLTGGGSAVDLYELTVDDPAEAPRVSEAATEILAPDFVVTDWRKLNRELFTALSIQKKVLFFVLLAIVVVSTFNVASTLVILVRERMRDVGILSALGLRPDQVRLVFLLYGSLLGTAGTLLGVAAGSGISWVLTTFELIRFDAEVAAIYFISSVPFRVEAGDLLAIVGSALAVTAAACFLAADIAARVDPAEALRYE